MFMINQLMVYSMKCQKGAKNAHLNFAEPNLTSTDCFCPNSSPKHKDASFIFINDTEQQQASGLKGKTSNSF